jgi:predicted nucleic acid-binding protein
MYLIDTNVISEQRKAGRSNPGVQRFFRQVSADDSACFLSVVTLGELRRGVELIRHRGDQRQAGLLEAWLLKLLSDYRENILDFTTEESQVWGRLRVPHPENALDKQIAATALIYGLTVVTRNVSDFTGSGVPLLNPFDA